MFANFQLQLLGRLQNLCHLSSIEGLASFLLGRCADVASEKGEFIDCQIEKSIIPGETWCTTILLSRQRHWLYMHNHRDRWDRWSSKDINGMIVCLPSDTTVSDKLIIWLAVYLPLWKIWVRQLELWNSQLHGQTKNHAPNHQSVMNSYK